MEGRFEKRNADRMERRAVLQKRGGPYGGVRIRTGRRWEEGFAYFLLMYLRMSTATALAMMRPLMICCQYGSTPMKVRP